MAVIFSPRSLCGCQCSSIAKLSALFTFPSHIRTRCCTIGTHCVWVLSGAAALRLISHRYTHIQASTHTDTRTLKASTHTWPIGKLSQQVSFATLGNNIYFIQLQNGQPLSCVLPARLQFFCFCISNHNDLRRSLSVQGLEGTAQQ